MAATASARALALLLALASAAAGCGVGAFQPPTTSNGTATNGTAANGTAACFVCSTACPAAGLYIAAPCSATANITCSPCPSYTFAASTTSTTCTPCSTPTSCGAGQFIISACSASADMVCGPCPVNTFTASAGASFCTPCGNSSAYAVGTAQGQSSCMCASGNTWNTASQTCQASVCPAGTYVTAPTTCATCPSLQYSTPGASLCTSCPALVDPTGSQSPPGSSYTTACVKSTLAAGTYTFTPSFSTCENTLAQIDGGLLSNPSAPAVWPGTSTAPPIVVYAAVAYVNVDSLPYFANANPMVAVYAIDQSLDTLLWSTGLEQYSGGQCSPGCPWAVVSKPAITGGVVVVASPSGTIFGLDVKTGTVKWPPVAIGSSGFVGTPTPSFDGSLVFVASTAGLTALSASTGGAAPGWSASWSSSFFTEAWVGILPLAVAPAGSPASIAFYACDSSNGVAAVTMTGDKVWQAPASLVGSCTTTSSWPGYYSTNFLHSPPPRLFASLTVVVVHVLAFNSYSLTQVVALSTADGTVLWKWPSGSSSSSSNSTSFASTASSFSRLNERLVTADSSGVIVIDVAAGGIIIGLNATTGSIMWQVPATSSNMQLAAILGPSVPILAPDGYLYMTGEAADQSGRGNAAAICAVPTGRIISTASLCSIVAWNGDLALSEPVLGPGGVILVTSLSANTWPYTSHLNSFDQFRGIGIVAFAGTASAAGTTTYNLNGLSFPRPTKSILALAPTCSYPTSTDGNVLIDIIVLGVLASLLLIIALFYFGMVRPDAIGTRQCCCLLDLLCCCCRGDSAEIIATQKSIIAEGRMASSGGGTEVRTNPMWKSATKAAQQARKATLHHAQYLASQMSSVSLDDAEDARENAHVRVPSSFNELGGGKCCNLNDEEEGEAAEGGPDASAAQEKMVAPSLRVSTGRFCPVYCAFCDPFREGIDSPFKAYGAGPTAYWKNLKLLVVLFLLTSLVCIPLFLISAAVAQPGTGINEVAFGSLVAAIATPSPSPESLGAVTNATGATSVLDTLSSTIPPVDYGVVYSLFDVMCSIIFFFTWVWARTFTIYESTAVSLGALTSADYSVLMPETFKDVTANELRDFFNVAVREAPPDRHLYDGRTWSSQSRGGVDDVIAEINLVYEATRESLANFALRGDVYAKFERAVARHAGLTKRLEELDLASGYVNADGTKGTRSCIPPRHRLPFCGVFASVKRTAAEIAALEAKAALLSARIKHNKTASSVVAAFVTFKKADTRAWVVAAFPDTLAEGAVCQRTNLTLRPGCCSPRTRVLPAPLAGSVRWANLHITDRTRTMRLLITYLLSFCVIVLAAGVLWGISWGKTQGPVESANATVTLGLQIASSFVVIGLNMSTSGIMKSLSRFVAYRSLEDEEASLFMRLAIVQFVNTAVLSIIVGASFPGTSSLPSYLHIGLDQDLEPEWYAGVGTQIVVTMAFNAVTVHMNEVIGAVRHWLNRRSLAARTALAEADDLDPEAAKARKSGYFTCCLANSTKPTQRDLTEAHRGPPNSFSEWYAALANVLAICFVFSSTMPLLLCVACVHFFISYHVQKTLFLWFYRAPPAFGVVLQSNFVALMPYLIVLKALWASWALTYGDALQWVSGADPYNAVGALNKVAPPAGATEFSLGRFVNVVAIPEWSAGGLTILLLVVAALLSTLAQYLQACLNIITCGVCSGKTAKDVKKEGFAEVPFYEEAAKKGVRGTANGIVGIHTYNILANPDVAAEFGLPIEFAEDHSTLLEAANYSKTKDATAASPTSPSPRRASAVAAPLPRVLGKSSTGLGMSTPVSTPHYADAAAGAFKSASVKVVVESIADETAARSNDALAAAQSAAAEQAEAAADAAADEAAAASAAAAAAMAAAAASAMAAAAPAPVPVPTAAFLASPGAAGYMRQQQLEQPVQPQATPAPAPVSKQPSPNVSNTSLRPTAAFVSPISSASSVEFVATAPYSAAAVAAAPVPAALPPFIVARRRAAVPPPGSPSDVRSTALPPVGSPNDLGSPLGASSVPLLGSPYGAGPPSRAAMVSPSVPYNAGTPASVAAVPPVNAAPEGRRFAFVLADATSQLAPSVPEPAASEHALSELAPAPAPVPSNVDIAASAAASVSTPIAVVASPRPFLAAVQVDVQEPAPSPLKVDLSDPAQQRQAFKAFFDSLNSEEQSELADTGVCDLEGTFIKQQTLTRRSRDDFKTSQLNKLVQLKAIVKNW